MPQQNTNQKTTANNPHFSRSNNKTNTTAKAHDYIQSPSKDNHQPIPHPFLQSSFLGLRADEMIRMFMFDRHSFLPTTRLTRVEYCTFNPEEFIRIKTATLNFFEPGILKDFGGGNAGFGVGV
jgi:hypothetical protein